MILKILTKQQWKQFQDTETFHGAPIDLKDGYIHFSTPAQVKETVAKHFAGQQSLIIAVVDEHQFGDELRWEVSRNQQLFPHLYAVLKLEHVSGTFDLCLGEDGLHAFPDGLLE